MVEVDALAKKGASMEAVATNSEKLTDKLKAALEDYPGSRAELARKADISPQMLQNYINGSSPRAYFAYRLAIAMGVDPLWFVNEDEPSTPIRYMLDLGLGFVQSAPDDVLYDELKRRYLPAAIRLHQLLHDEQTQETEWERIALEILLGGSRHELTEEQQRAIDHVKRIDKVAYDTERLNAGNLGGNFIPSFDAEMKLSVNPTELQCSRLAETEQELRDAHPGIYAINNYSSASRNAIYGHGKTHHDEHTYFMACRAGYHIARILNHSTMRKHPQRREIVSFLRTKGFCDKKGNPSPFPQWQDRIPFLDSEKQNCQEWLDGKYPQL